ncbi:hypothetical protein IL992_00190 [Microbispora sp. NEAU-D428]|uniref:hypothetical protein n=1 Tax=Microbispora sitophila TaxID=2771537 RepID=UPI001867ACB2|nr:hypothetical protein [Microbispora sitophila]MBE3007621.1 hypothetical protein [Microbispora sitophila]
MTPPLTGQRSRSELIAELYERHAAGLFAYCHDQLGETASAADAVVAVFTAAPTAEPPSRAALYALARREIYRRDVSYALPAVDSVADPATSLIERVFRDIRPHQREVLLLSEVCGLTAPELALVLDVAADTAEDLIAGATRRFAQTLETAVTAARSAPFVPASVAEVYDAIGVSPLGDVLARLPWHRPAASVRDRVLSALPYEEPGSPTTGGGQSSGLVTKRLWPTTPTWPLPLSDPDQVTNTCVVKTDAIAQPQGSRRKAKHEATTEPMPRLRGALLNSLGESRLRRKRTGRPTPAERPAALAAPVEPSQASAQEPPQTAPATPPPAPQVAETVPGPFDAFGTSDASYRADPFDAFGTAPRPAEPFDAFGTASTPHPAEPLDAFGTAPRPAEPFDAFGSAGTPRPAEPFNAFGTAPRPAEPFDAFGTAGTPHPAEPLDAFGTAPRPAEPFNAFGTAHTPHPAEPLDALFNTLRFAVPFDAFRTAEAAGTSRQPESTGAFPRTEEPSDEAPLTPPAEALLPAAPPMDVFAPAPRETVQPAEQLAGPFLPAEEPPAEADGERAAEEPPAKTDTLVHPAAAVVPVPAPAASRRPSRRSTASRHTGSKRAGRPAGGKSAGRSRRGKGDRHYDWLWEVVGILICLIIALIVFFNVPTVFTP